MTRAQAFAAIAPMRFDRWLDFTLALVVGFWCI
jgi:hypothetical protein